VVEGLVGKKGYLGAKLSSYYSYSLQATPSQSCEDRQKLEVEFEFEGTGSLTGWI